MGLLVAGLGHDAPAHAEEPGGLPPAPWQPDNGDGTYTNPVLFADYSDPDLVGVDGNYYLTASSFNSVPGLPILRSRDLVNWKLVNYGLPQLYAPEFKTPQHGNGVWAPSFRHHEGQYYIYWGDPDRGIYMIRSEDPRGKWTKPTLVKKAYGNIDPCPLWDDDGRVYMVHAFAHSRAGVKSLLTVVELTKDGTKSIDKGWIVFDGHAEHPTIEGPKFYKRNGYYYIFAPAGGVTEGWQLVLRSNKIRGPYEARKVLAQGSTQINGPHQGGWVETPAGETWFMHFQDDGAYGRVVHLQPMQWVDDWPVMGEAHNEQGVGQPVLRHDKPKVASAVERSTPATSDSFSGHDLGLQWQWHATPQPTWWSLSRRPGWLQLKSVPQPAGYRNLWDAGNLLLQKLPAEEFRVTSRIDASSLKEGEVAGLLMMGQDYSYVGIEKKAGSLEIVRRSCINAESGASETTLATTPLDNPQLELRIDVSKQAVCSFSFRVATKDWQEIGGPFTAREGKWIGAKVGLFSMSNVVDSEGGAVAFDSFLVESLPTKPQPVSD